MTKIQKTIVREYTITRQELKKKMGIEGTILRAEVVECVALGTESSVELRITTEGVYKKKKLREPERVEGGK